MSRPGQGSRSNSRTENQLCRNNCRYYGNIIWDGYCSKCYREVYQKTQNVQEKVDQTTSNVSSDGKFSASSHWSPSFQNFSEKRRSHTYLTKPFRRFVGGSTMRLSNNSTNLMLSTDDQTGEGRAAIDQLDRMISDEAKNDIKSQVKSFANNFQKKSSANNNTVEYLRDEYVTFRDSLKKRIQSNPIYRDENEDLILLVRDYLEKIIFSKHYSSIFQLITSDNETKDLSIQSRINSLQWITPPMLDAILNENLSTVTESMYKAMNALMEIDSKTTPQGKIESIIDCKNFLEESIRASSSSGINADNFLPALIYVVLKARPPRLHSNIQFLSLFSQPSGEQLYYLANLDSAVRFIELIDAQHLGLSSDDFSRYMSGQPIEKSKLGSFLESVTPDPNKNQQMRKNFILFYELDNHCEKFDDSITEFKRRLTQTANDIQEMINESYSRFPPMDKLPQLVEIDTNYTVEPTSGTNPISTSILDILDQSTAEDDQLPAPLSPEKLQQTTITGEN